MRLVGTFVQAFIRQEFPTSELLRFQTGRGNHSHMAVVMIRNHEGIEVAFAIDCKTKTTKRARYGVHATDLYIKTVCKIRGK